MKKIISLLVALVLLSSCGALDTANSLADGLVSGLRGNGGSNNSSGDYDYEDDAEQLENERTFYNSYLGVSLSLPAGWWLYETYPENFGRSAETTSDPALMDISKDDISYYMQLLDCATLQYSTKINHLGFFFEAEKLLDASSVEDFIEYNAQYMYNSVDGEFVLLDTSSVNIAGREFVSQTYLIPRAEDPYNELVLTCELNEGYFLVIYMDYWPENVDAEEYAIKFLNENLTLN